MAEIRHRSILANGIRMHIAEAGEGFPVAHITRCSHWTQQEKPDEVNRLILDFIADLR